MRWSAVAGKSSAGGGDIGMPSDADTAVDSGSAEIALADENPVVGVPAAVGGASSGFTDGVVFAGSGNSTALAGVETRRCNIAATLPLSGEVKERGAEGCWTTKPADTECGGSQ